MSPVAAEEGLGKAVMGVTIVAKDIICVVHYYQDGVLQFYKWVCRMGGKAFKRLVHCAVAIVA